MINGNILGMLQQFKSNPMQMLSKRFNIPQGLNGPQDIVQHLLNTNQISQQQLNQAVQMRNNPAFQQLFKK